MTDYPILYIFIGDYCNLIKKIMLQLHNIRRRFNKEIFTNNN